MKTICLNVFISAAIFSCTLAHGQQQPVRPGQEFPNDQIIIRAPNSEGWKLINSNSRGMDFAKAGKASNESYGAQVTLFRLQETKDKDEFLALIKSGSEQDMPLDRFKPIQLSYEYTEERGFPCVRIIGVVEDMKAKTFAFFRENLKLQSHSLLCRYPKIKNAGIAINYSHRGDGLDPQLDEQARSFIEGIQLVAEKTEPQPAASAAPK